jgi:hypothetical protein
VTVREFEVQKTLRVLEQELSRKGLEYGFGFFGRGASVDKRTRVDIPRLEIFMVRHLNTTSVVFPGLMRQGGRGAISAPLTSNCPEFTTQHQIT